MGKTFFRNLFRDIRKTLSRFLSIVIIIAVGVAFYAGVRATSPDMKMSGDKYFSENNLMDFRIISTLGLTKDDIEEISKVSGVKSVEGEYSLDAVIEREGRSLVLNVNSLPKSGGINDIRLIEGRRPENPNEAIVEDGFLEENKLKLGDSIELKSGGEKGLEDRLENTLFKIVGTAKSPLYISAQRQLSSVGNGSVRGFVYILGEAFKGDIYSEAYVRVDREESKDSLFINDEYKDAVKPVETALKDIGTPRGEIRYQEVVVEGRQKLNDAEEELQRGRKEAEEKFSDAHRKIDEGRAKLLSGSEDLRKNEALFNEKMAEGQKKIDDGKRGIQEGEKTLSLNAKVIENGRLEIEKGKLQLDEGERLLKKGKQDAARGISAAVAGKVEEARLLMLENPHNPIYEYKYDAIKKLYDDYIYDKDFDGIYLGLKNANMIDNFKPELDIEALNTSFKAEESKIAAGRVELQKREAELKVGEAKLNAGRLQLEESKRELLKGEEELKKGREEGSLKLSKAKADLLNGEAELNKNAEKLRDEEEKVSKKLKDAEDEINGNREKLNEVKKPEWFVLGRGTNVGYETYRQDSERIDSIGKAFPLIFFLVAALVSLTTMTRMVQDKRVEIGTFKALGYSSSAIVAHYLIYALSASIIGSLVGISIGFRLFPPLIMTAYGSLYSIPYMVTPFNTGIALQASLVAVIFVAAAAAGATMEELRENPAALMRPKPPKSGKTILLERIGFIWRRLSFTRKVTARNIFRYKQRLVMTVIGIAACTALMITGFGLKEGIIGATEAQFSRVYKYDMQSSLSKNIGQEEKNEIKAKAEKDSNIKSTMFFLSKNSSVKIDDSKGQDAYVVVPENKTSIGSFISLTMDGKELSLGDDGVIITEKLSRLVNKKPGDIINITVNDKSVEAKISGITEHYIQHYVYMSPEYYERLTGEKIVYNGFYGLLNNTSEEQQESTAKELKEIKNISSVGFKNNIQIDYDKSMNSINSVVLVLIVSAGVLAFVVIYNLTNINIAERRRELATIKLLGFYNNELASYIYRENMILTLIGSITGIFLGIILNHYILLSAETNVIMFLNKISPIYFLYSVLLTIGFSLIVNAAMYKRFDRIDMIESLKSVE